MKKTAIYISIGALFLSLVLAQPAIASEISGTINTSGNSGDDSATPTPTPTPNPSGDNDQGHSSEVGGPMVIGFVTNGNDIYTGTTTINGTVTGGSTGTSPGISDEEAAHLAMQEFGPRFGVSSGGGYPGAPDAGGSNTLSVGSASAGTAPEATSIAYVPRAGEGPVLPNDSAELAASAIAGGGGLSMTQLILIAIIGLIVVGSMGYAISKSNQRRLA